MGDLKAHWEAQGHEVIRDRYFDPVKVDWADVSFFEFCTVGTQRASDPNDELWKNIPQPLDKNIIVRAHDIDIWTGQTSIVKWNWVNNLVFVADHMKKECLRGIKIENTKVHMIPHGINTEKYTFRDKPRGNKIAWVGNINWPKNLSMALQVLLENPEYELHVVGGPYNMWHRAYIDGLVRRNNLKFFYTDRVEDMNQFMEDKDFILVTSMKEAFSFVTGEAMSKGIKPLINHFYGAEDIWDPKYLFDKVSEVKEMLKDSNPIEYRNFIEARYPLNKMLSAYDSIINNK